MRAERLSRSRTGQVGTPVSVIWGCRNLLTGSQNRLLILFYLPFVSQKERYHLHARSSASVFRSLFIDEARVGYPGTKL
jgi:hypothetical protein